jgi:hypothetical protein
MSQYTNDICSNCGASQGIHHYETSQCPRNGREECRDGYQQIYVNTTFEDSGQRNLERSAHDLLEALKNCQKLIKNFGENEDLKLQVDSAIRNATIGF